MTRASLLLLLTAASLGCDRPFVEEAAPSITVVEPADLQEVVTASRLPVRLDASSFRDVARVEVDGRDAAFDAETGTWVDTLDLERGLNRFLVTAIDAEGLENQDTLYAVRLRLQMQGTPQALPEPRGGHAATSLADGRLLVTGGAVGVGAPASDRAFLFDPATGQWEAARGRMRFARTGHTASLLPDGRVLLVGGSRREAFVRLTDFVETPEVFDPRTGQFDTLAVSTSFPIRRALHTATVRQPRFTEPPFLDLLFGIGDVRYDPPTLRIKPDLRRFIVYPDSLVAVVRQDIDVLLDNSDDELFGHTQTPIGNFTPPSLGRYLVAGSYFDDAGGRSTVAFTLAFTSMEIQERRTAAFERPRTRHAAVRVNPGLVLFSGGRGATAAEALDDVLLYAEEADAFFRFSEEHLRTPRFGHRVTNLPSRRILMTGGFDASGNALSETAYLLF